MDLYRREARFRQVSAVEFEGAPLTLIEDTWSDDDDPHGTPVAIRRWQSQSGGGIVETRSSRRGPSVADTAPDLLVGTVLERILRSGGTKDEMRAAVARARRQAPLPDEQPLDVDASFSSGVRIQCDGLTARTASDDTTTVAVLYEGEGTIRVRMTPR